MPLLFNGVDQWVDTGYPLSLEANESFSISCWVNIPADEPVNPYWFGGMGSAAHINSCAIVGLRLGWFIDFWGVDDAGRAITCQGTADLRSLGWLHILSVWDADIRRSRAYINAVPVTHFGDAWVGPATVTSPVGLGALNSPFFGGPQQWYKGLLAEVGVWRGIHLTQWDATCIFALPSVARTLEPANLVHFWPLEGNPGSVASDPGSVFDLCSPASNGTPYGEPIYAPAVQGYQGLLGARVNEPDD